MGNKINSLRGREEEEVDENGDVRTRSISVGGGSSSSSLRAMTSSMSASSASRYTHYTCHVILLHCTVKLRSTLCFWGMGKSGA